MLELNQLTVRFGGLVAVNGISLKVDDRDFLGLVGPNGAGKTTLFNAISGLVSPEHGRMFFNNVDIRRKPLHRRARLGIGRTFQVPQPMHELTVRENLMVAQRFGVGRTNPRRIDELLDFLQLTPKADHDAATELTLAELKALEVGKALATEPKLLLLDEVLSGLETAGKRRFMQTLIELHRSYEIGILIIEHDIETISSLCDRVCVMDFGRLIAEGTAQEVFNDPEVIKSYTGDGHA